MPSTDPKQIAGQQMLTWLYIGSMVMIFAGLTSAYLVSRAEGNWLEFELPRVLWASTAVILLSSLSLHGAVLAARQQAIYRTQALLALTLLLGIAFLFMQGLAWQNLVVNKIFFVGNAAGSFLYVLTGMHALHLVAGLIAMGVMVVRAIRLRIGPGADRLRGLEQTALFWHALDFLWCFLFLFLALHH